MPLDRVGLARDAMTAAFEQLAQIRAEIAVCLEGLKAKTVPDADDVIRQHMQLEFRWQQTYDEYSRLHNAYLAEVYCWNPVPHVGS